MDSEAHDSHGIGAPFRAQISAATLRRAATFLTRKSNEQSRANTHTFWSAFIRDQKSIEQKFQKFGIAVGGREAKENRAATTND